MKAFFQYAQKERRREKIANACGWSLAYCMIDESNKRISKLRRRRRDRKNKAKTNKQQRKYL